MIQFLRLQHSHLEFWHIWVQRCRLQCLHDRIAGLDGINNFVDPQPRRSITRIGLLVVGTLYRLEQFFLVFLAQDFAAAFQLLDLDFDQCASGGVATRSEEHTSELQSRVDLVCRLLLEKKKSKSTNLTTKNVVMSPANSKLGESAAARNW